MLLKGILCAVALKNIDSYLEDTMPACASVVGMPQSCVCVQMHGYGSVTGLTWGLTLGP